MEYSQEKEILTKLESIDMTISSIKNILVGKPETRKAKKKSFYKEMTLKEQEQTIEELFLKYGFTQRLKEEEGSYTQYVKDITTLITGNGCRLKDVEETFNSVSAMNKKGKVAYLKGYIVNSIRNIKYY